MLDFRIILSLLKIKIFLKSIIRIWYLGCIFVLAKSQIIHQTRNRTAIM